MTVNKYKGELEVNLNQKTYKTRLTLDGIVRIEEDLKKSILEIANDLMMSKVKMTEVIAVLTQALRGGGNNLDQKEIGRLIFDAGMIEALKVTGEILTTTITGGDKEVEEKNVDTESKPTD